jgi:uncharacterized RDD family membrane protein YckC
MQMPPELPTYNPYAAPISRLEDINTQVLHLATRGSRLGAYLLDLLSFALLGIVAAIAIPSFSKAGGDAENVGIAVVVIAMLAISVVHIVFLHKYGQTIGKRLLGIKVVQANGMRCELWRFFFLRALPVGILSNIPFIGMFIGLADSLMIFGQEQRCLHDLTANTVVIQA